MNNKELTQEEIDAPRMRKLVRIAKKRNALTITGPAIMSTTGMNYRLYNECLEIETRIPK